MEPIDESGSDRGTATAERERPARRMLTLELTGVLLILGVAAFFRGYLNNSGIPGRVFPRNDEVHYVLRVMGFFGGVWGDRNFINPSLYLYLLYGVSWLAGHVLVLGGVFDSFDGFVADAATNPYWVTIVGRAITIALGVASVALLYSIARRMFSVRAAFVAAAAMAVNLTTVQRGVLAGTSGTMVFLVLAFFLSVLRYLEAPTAGKHMTCGLLLGLATSTKYNAGIHAIVLVVATLLGVRAFGRVWSRLRESRFWVGFPAFMAAFLAASPLIAVRPHEFSSEIGATLGGLMRGFPVGPEHELGWTYYVTSFPGQNNGLAHALLCVAGLFIALRGIVQERDARAVLLPACVLPLYLFFGPGQSSQMRFFLPAIPFVLVLGALAVDSILALSPAAGGGGVLRKTLVTFALLVLLLTPTALKTHRIMERSYGRPDARGEHSTWLLEHMDPEGCYLEVGTTSAYYTFEDDPLFPETRKRRRLRLAEVVDRSPTLDDLIVRVKDLGCDRLVLYLGSGDIGADEERAIREAATSLGDCQYQDDLGQCLLGLERTPILATRDRRIVWCALELR